MGRFACLVVLIGILASCSDERYKTYATTRPDSTRWELHLDSQFKTFGTGDTLLITKKIKCVSFKLRSADSEIHLNMVLERGWGLGEILLGDGGEVARSSATDSGSVAKVCR